MSLRRHQLTLFVCRTIESLMMEMATFRLQYCLSCENMTETYGLLVLRPLAVSERANETGYIPIWS